MDRGAPPLTSAEIRLFLRDSTLSHQGETRVWHVYLRPDGSMAGLGVHREDRSTVRAAGRWEVRDEGLFCREWQGDWGGGVEGCAEVFRFGNEYLFVEQRPQDLEEVRAEFRRKRRPGNPQNL